MNFCQCIDEARAQTLQAELESLHHDPSFVMRQEREVAEIVCNNAEVAREVRQLIGWQQPARVTWHFEGRLAPLAASNDMLWNDLSNALSATENSSAPTTHARVAELASHFQFGNDLLVKSSVVDGKPQLSTVPSSMSRPLGTDAVALHFEQLPTVDGVPVVTLSVDEVCTPFRVAPASLDAATRSRLISSTPAWPSDGQRAKAAVLEALAGHEQDCDRCRVERLLAWVNAHVRFGGEKVGSRYGFDQVLGQGYGHCWDKADVLLTLCRAAGFPSREVFGWLHGGEGHVWVETWLVDADKVTGWLDVDATTSWLGISGEYVPVLLSEDGRAPAAWWAPPKITAPSSSAVTTP